MDTFKLALSFLTRFNWNRSSHDKESLSRSLAHYPVVGMLLAASCVLLDLALKNLIPRFWIDGLILAVLVWVRRSRQMDGVLGDSEKARWIFLLPKFFMLSLVPESLRWISISFMCAYSSAILALTLKLVRALNYSWENVIWALGTVFFLSLLCGPLGLFTLGFTWIGVSVLFKWFKKHSSWYEEVVELCSLSGTVLYVRWVFHFI